jgi:murein DD-endopeptidase MepM/ murein hydrolase activator NlpD
VDENVDVPQEHTLYAMEQAHPHTMPLLSAAITSDSTGARGGAELQVQDGALLATGGPLGVSEFAESGSSEIRVYTVREGDTLSMVAEMFGVTTNTILWANDLPRATQIQPDDTLIILPVAGVQHEVTSGDTIGGIATKYDVEADEILSFNQLTDADDLAVGDRLIIPGGTIQSVQARAASVKPVKISGSVSTPSAGFVHPVPGAIRTQGLHGNNGVDFAAGHGTAIRASAAGEVIVSKSSGWNGGYGQYVVIRHNSGAQTLYAHLSSNAVGVGAYVAQGEVIGGMGNTGRSTGTHLHFEVRGARNPF